MSFPTLTFRIATGDPLSASPDWVSFTGVLNFQISRGRNYILDRIQAGEMTVRVLNQDGVLDPNNSSSPLYPDQLPGKLVQLYAVYSSTTYYLFTGFVTGFPRYYGAAGLVDEVEIKAVDGFRRWNRHLLSQTFEAELSGLRIVTLADAMDWPGAGLLVSTGYRAIGAGQSVMQSVEIEKRSALEHAYHVDLSEEGLFYFSGRGAATFKDRASLSVGVYATSQATFAAPWESGKIGFTDLTPSFDDELVYNDVTVGRVGGTDAQAVDEDSITAYGRNSLSIPNTLISTDLEVEDRAWHTLSTHKDPKYRFQRIEFLPQDPQHATVAWPAALGLDLGMRLTVEKDELAGYTLTQDVNLQHINHEVTIRGGMLWTTRFALSLADPNIGSLWSLNFSTLAEETRPRY